jgi:phosphoribosylformylglycinamidine synthase
MRNVAAVGAYPQALTDCLNYGNPEKPDQMNELKEGIEGIAAACKNVKLKNYRKYPTPIISGNVSLYNEGKSGHVPPSAIICCIGKIDDCTTAVTMKFKKAGSKIYLLGDRKNELGGSEYYRIFDELGANVPKPDFAEAQKEIYTVTDAIGQGLVLAAHDISEGGIAVTLAEMSFGGSGDGVIGFETDLQKVPQKNLREDVKLFSETGGFVLEIPAEKEKKFLAVCKKNKLNAHEIGMTLKKPVINIKNGGKTLINIPVSSAAGVWLLGLRQKLQ